MDPRIEIALTLFGLLLNSGLLTAGAVALRKALDRRIGPERAATVTALAGEAVRATEQIAQRHGWNSETKYHQAALRLQAFAASHNITLDSVELETLIESAVHAMKSAGAAFSAPPVVNITGVTPNDIATDLHAALQPLLAAPVTSAAKPLAADDALPAKQGDHQHVAGQLA